MDIRLSPKENPGGINLHPSPRTRAAWLRTSEKARRKAGAVAFAPICPNVSQEVGELSGCGNPRLTSFEHYTCGPVSLPWLSTASTTFLACVRIAAVKYSDSQPTSPSD